MGPENMATQIDGIGVIHLTIAIRPEIKIYLYFLSVVCMNLNVFDIKIMVKSNAIEIVSIPDFWEPFWIYQLINNTYPAKLYSKDYLQLPLRQWGAGNFYFLVLSS